MQPSHRQYSWVPSKMGNCCLSMNFWRSVEEKPSALPLRSRLRNSLVP